MDVLKTTRSSSTIDELCERHGFSRSFYQGLKRDGRGPRETEIDGLIRIMDDDEAAWIESFRNPSPSQAMELEENARVRRERALKAAKRAVASTEHISRKPAGHPSRRQRRNRPSLEKMPSSTTPKQATA